MRASLLARILLLVAVCCALSACVRAHYDVGDEDDPSKCKSSCRDGLVCLNMTCSSCSNSMQCGPQRVCGKTKYEGRLVPACRHLPLLKSFSSRDVLAFIIFVLAAAISAGGGVGGGGIFVPILILLSQFTPKEAVPLSNTIVSGASVANFVQNFNKRNPYVRNRPLIDYTVALLIEPQTLGGTIFGVYLHEIFPSWLTLLLLIIVMSLTTYRTLKKGISIFKAERKAEKTNTTTMTPTVVHDDHPSPTTDEKSPLIPPPEKSTNTHSSDDLIESDLESSSCGGAKTPWIKILALLFILIASTTLSILKGGGDTDTTSPVGIKLCSPVYWLTSLAIFPLIFAVWGYYGVFVIKQTRERREQGLPPVEGDCVWTPKRVVIVGFVSMLAGIMASLLGVGGGLIKSPVLLEIGISAEVTAATSSYMILFTSMSSSIQYAILGKIPMDYGITLFVLGLLASFLGQTVLNWLVAKYNRKSYIIFVIAFVIGTSALLLIVTEGVTFFQTGGNDHFSWIC